MTRLFAAFGRPVLGALASLGRVAIYAGHTFAAALRPPFYGREFLSALMQVGWLSLPVVGLTAIFTGGAELACAAADRPSCNHAQAG